MFSAGVACTYTLSSTIQSLTSASATPSVGVTAATGCAWTASSNASWITVTSGTPGSGNGTLNYSVAANASGVQRSGAIIIAGQTFTVNQSAGAAPVTYTIWSPDVVPQSYTATGPSSWE